MPHMCRFSLIEEAVAWAKERGGWIAVGNDGAVLWFDASKWTWSPISTYIAHNHDGGEIGAWPLWDKTHEVHKALNRVLAEVPAA